MAFTKEIVTYTVSGEENKFLRLRNGLWGRSIGTDWNSIRFGFRLCSNSGQSDEWQFMLNAGTAKMWRRATCDHACGVHMGNGSSLGNSGAAYAGTSQSAFLKIVDSSVTANVNIGGSAYWGGGVASNLPGIIILDVTKGSPNWNFKLYTAQSTSNANATRAQFVAAMDDPTTSTLLSAVWGGGGTDRAVDEATDGSLDTVSIGGYNDSGLELYITDCDVRILS